MKLTYKYFNSVLQHSTCLNVLGHHLMPVRDTNTGDNVNHRLVAYGTSHVHLPISAFRLLDNAVVVTKTVGLSRNGYSLPFRPMSQH